MDGERAHCIERRREASTGHGSPRCSDSDRCKREHADRSEDMQCMCCEWREDGPGESDELIARVVDDRRSDTRDNCGRQGTAVALIADPHIVS